jgi:5-formyltetrahydrofolate cyclo-ligase
MTKQQLRKLYLAKRQQLSEGELAQLNFSLYQNFFSQIDLSFIKVLHTFLPIAAKHEVDTWLIIDRIRREYPHTRISVPKVNETTGELDHFFFEGLHQLTTNAWGIQEPKQGIPTEPAKIDMVLVPLLAVDMHGNRIGYGKGYYDKFLAQCRTDVQKVGLSLFPPVDVIPTEAYDIKLSSCVSPNNYYSFTP